MLVAPLLLAFGGLLIARSLKAHPAYVEIPGPRDWVPFSADVRVTFPGINGVTTGRFYRSSDGSGRLETTFEGRELEGPLVSIRNVSERMSYVGRGLAWTSTHLGNAPMSGPARWREGTVGLTKLPQRVSLSPGADTTSGSDLRLLSEGGYETYRWSVGSVDCLLVPKLNFFPVVRNSLLSGRREVYSNIVVGEQPPGLFSPPPGATIKPSEDRQASRPTGATRSGSRSCTATANTGK